MEGEPLRINNPCSTTLKFLIVLQVEVTGQLIAPQCRAHCVRIQQKCSTTRGTDSCLQYRVRIATRHTQYATSFWNSGKYFLIIVANTPINSIRICPWGEHVRFEWINMLNYISIHLLRVTMPQRSCHKCMLALKVMEWKKHGEIYIAVLYDARPYGSLHSYWLHSVTRHTSHARTQNTSDIPQKLGGMARECERSPSAFISRTVTLHGWKTRYIAHISARSFQRHAVCFQ